MLLVSGSMTPRLIPIIDANQNLINVKLDPPVSRKNEVLDRLNTFRVNRELCDVVLFVKEREIYAHKVVLASVSPALHDMFMAEDEQQSENNGSKSPTESKNGEKNASESPVGEAASLKPKQPSYFEFAQSDFDCFEALINFAYTAHLEISSRKVPELYKTAFSLRMTPVVKACANFLAENLTVKNCIGVRKQANFSADTFLLGHVDRFISDNFEQIVNDSVEFTQLPCIKTRILSSGPVVEQGADIADRTLHYFENLPHDRIEYSIEFLSKKTHLLYLEEDLSLADCAELNDHVSVGSADIIQDYKRSGRDVAKAVFTADALGVAPIQHRVTGAVPVRLNASRMPNVRYSSTESLNSVDSEDGSDPGETIETRLIATTQTAGDYWVSLVVLYRRLVVLSIQITDDDELTKVRSTQNNSSNLDKSALLSRLISCTGTQRIPLATMNFARCSIGASFVNGKIIVCGGYDRGECLKTVEEYDVVAGTWKQLQSMRDERGRFDSAVLNGKVYAVAGSNGNHDLKTAEMYDPKENKWTAIANLSRARSHNGCTALDDFIYCVGGSNDQNVMRECERFNSETQVWEDIAPLECGRYQAGVIAWRGLIVACGGCDRWSCMDTVEAYDPKTNSWRQLAKMRTSRRGCAVAVIRDVLYVIGGHDGTQSLTSVEILESPTSNWRPGAPLTTPRANTHAVVTAGNVIYVVGGFNGNQFLNSIELLESEMIGWRNWQQSSVDNLTEVDEESEELSSAATPAHPVNTQKPVNAN